METVTLKLPKTVLDQVREEIGKGRFASVGEYFSTLVREDRKRKAIQEVNALIREGLESPVSEMTKADWDELRQIAKHGPSKREKS